MTVTDEMIEAGNDAAVFASKNEVRAILTAALSAIEPAGVGVETAHKIGVRMPVDFDQAALKIWQNLGFANDRLNQVAILADELRRLCAALTKEGEQ